MRIGTRSLLFGFHQPLIHTWFVAAAWTQLYGFPWDFRLWCAFVVHDLGYWGKPNMDGPEGETHPEFGAKAMSIFGPGWRDFTLLHSRFYAERVGRPVSRLCMADKLAICLTPRWLWKLLISLSGERQEYLTVPKYAVDMKDFASGGLNAKHAAMCTRLRQWVAEMSDG